MFVPSFINDDNSTLGLVKQKLDQFRVAFIGQVVKFDSDKQTVDVKPVVTEPTYKPDGSVENMAWPQINNIPLCNIGFDTWFVTMPVAVGSNVLVVCSDLGIEQWFKRGQSMNNTNEARHSLNNAIAIAGVNPSTKSISNFFMGGPEIRDKTGNISLQISSNGFDLKIGSNTLISITSSSIAVKVGGTNVLTIDSSGVDIPSKEITIKGTKIYDWLTTHTHQYIAPAIPAGPANTEPAGPQ